MHWSRQFRNIVNAKTERDLQRKVGPSNLSNPCSKCLAYDLLGVPGEENPYTMGAWIGTAIHARLEELINDSGVGWVTERKLTIGDLGTYGTVRGSCDLYIPEERMVVDFKTTTRDKLPKLIADFKGKQESLKVRAYIAQMHLYGLGAELIGDPVDKLTVIFIPRDSVTYDDLRHVTVEYDPDYAERVLSRGRAIWEWLEDGGDPDLLDSEPGCFTCDYSHR